VRRPADRHIQPERGCQETRRRVDGSWVEGSAVRRRGRRSRRSGHPRGRFEAGARCRPRGECTAPRRPGFLGPSGRPKAVPPRPGSG
jgi:hypothetical protein